MAGYDFSSLSPEEFERLCHDLLERDLGARLKSFTSGKDRGIDLRHAPAEGVGLVVQCKHYASSSYSTLLSHLRKVERPKIERLNPARYVLATSISMTPDRADDIAKVLSPHCKTADDIYGREDLNDLLRKHPDIERSSFKLWLTSESVMQRVLLNAAFVRAEYRAQELRRKLQLYVETKSAAVAHEMLEREHVCVIAGGPGIGKSTMAEILMVRYAEAGWELVEIQQNLQEAMDVYRSDSSSKQLFYYDDFLGQIAIGDKLQKNEEKGLQQLIDLVRRHPNKRFILTTREYILAQAKEQYEALRRTDVDFSKIVLALEDYDDVQKARILANHLFFNGVSQDHINSIVESRVYRKIIKHRNYTPRLIESMTRRTQWSNHPPAEYPAAFLRLLDDPHEVWDHPFRSQLRPLSRSVLLWMTAIGMEVYACDVQKAVFGATETLGPSVGINQIDFQKSLNELEGDFISIVKYPSGTVLRFRNPSVLDYLTGYLRTTPADVAGLITSTPFFETLPRLVSLLGGGKTDANSLVLIRPHSRLLQQAYVRTYESVSATLIPHRLVFEEDRQRYSWRLTGRLQYGLELCVAFQEPEWYDMLRSMIDKFMAALPTSRVSGADLVTLLARVEAVPAWTVAQRAAWDAVAKDYLTKDIDSYDEGVASAKWVASHSHLLTDSEREQFDDDLVTVFEREVPQLAEEENDLSLVEDMITTLRELASIFELDLNYPVDVLRDRRKTLEEEQTQPAEDWDERPSGLSGHDDIDGLFESLRN